ncbi:major facilitator superfamily domain containing protein [Echinococcus multilocularis]|uniref:Major facilitator superfamily domain containing protein n=1 Tax=Echinococcus multilocularis TaxID=6211 RepID=A0A087W0J5_ECHMU|nr:major facilitator superfamily domain containing protein [Echinococcus multilocularis]
MRKGLLFIMFCYLLIDLMASTLMLPWLPTIIKEMCEKDMTLVAIRRFVHGKILGVPEGAELSSRDASFVGSISSSLMSLAQYVSSSTSGAMSDSLGRKPVLLTLHTLGVISYLLWSASGASFIWFVLARILSGVSRANVGVLSAMVSDVSDRETRTRGMATVGVAYSIAFLVGPPASAWLLGRLFFNSKAGVSVLEPHIGLAAASLAVLDYICLFSFPETASLPGGKDDDAKVKKEGASSGSFWQSLKLLNPLELFRFRNIEDKIVQAKLQQMARVFFLNMLLFSGLECSLLFLAQLRFGYTGQDQGRIFITTGVTMIIIQSGFVKRFKGGREAKTACWAMGVQVLAYLVLGFSNSELLFYLGLVFFSFASGSFVPAFNGLASLSIGPQQQGQTMGTFRSLGGLARSVGPSLIGGLMWLVGPSIAFTLGALATFLVSVLFRRIPNLNSITTHNPSRVMSS